MNMNVMNKCDFHLTYVNSSSLQMTFSASPYSDPIQGTRLLPHGSEQTEMLWVMGPVLAVVLIIIIVIAILLFKK